MTKAWTDDAWDDFLYWTEQDKKTLRQIKKLLKDIDRNGYKGIRFCIIVLQCNIRRITEELGGQYHIAAGIVYNLRYCVTAEAVGSLY